MKSTITIEQFDNGISIFQEYDDGATQAIVSLDHSKEKDFGALMMADIISAMNEELCNKVKIEINIEPIKPQDNGI